MELCTYCKLYQIKNFAFLQGENQLGVKHVTQIPENERKKLRIGTVGMVVTSFHRVAVLWIRIQNRIQKIIPDLDPSSSGSKSSGSKMNLKSNCSEKLVKFYIFSAEMLNLKVYKFIFLSKKYFPKKLIPCHKRQPDRNIRKIHKGSDTRIRYQLKVGS
jgi:hypothetical protein